MYLAKLKSNGEWEWAKRLGASNYQSQLEGIGLDVDAKGNVYIAGSIHGTAQIDTAHVTCLGNSDMFIARFSSDGDADWVCTVGAGASVVKVGALRHDAQSNIYLCGYFTGGAQFDPKTVFTSMLGFNDLFVAKYSDNGNFVWARQGSGHGAKTAESITLDKNDNIFITGNFVDTIHMGSTALASNGMQTLYAAAYAQDGSLKWARQAYQGGATFPHSLGLDAEGNIYLSGGFSDTITCGNISLMSVHSAQDFFFTRLSQHCDLSLKKTSAELPVTEDLTSFDLNKATRSVDLTFSVKGDRFTRLGLYDMLGNFVSSYTDEVLSTGTYHAKIEMKKIEAGEYYFRLQTGENKQTRKIEF
jgi:hypothetical protein